MSPEQDITQQLNDWLRAQPNLRDIISDVQKYQQITNRQVALPTPGSRDDDFSTSSPEEKAARMISHIDRAEFGSFQEYSYVAAKEGSEFSVTRLDYKQISDAADLYDLFPYEPGGDRDGWMADIVEEQFGLPRGSQTGDSIKFNQLYGLVGQVEGKTVIQGAGRIHLDFVARPNLSNFKLVFDNPDSAQNYVQWLKESPNEALRLVFRQAINKLPTNTTEIGRHHQSDPFRSPIKGVHIKELGGSISTDGFSDKAEDVTLQAAPARNAEAAAVAAPEDEAVASVEAVSVIGKYPQGLEIGGKQFIAPTGPDGWREDFIQASGIGDFKPWSDRSLTPRVEFSEMVERKPFVDKHFLAALPVSDIPGRAPNRYPGRAVLIFTASQDQNVHDSSFRHARDGSIYIVLPIDKANALMKQIIDRPDGGDIATRFLEKAAPGLMARDLNSSGVRWVKSNELVVFGTKQFNEIVGAWETRNWRDIQRIFDKEAWHKPYSTPYGVGTPADRYLSR